MFWGPNQNIEVSSLGSQQVIGGTKAEEMETIVSGKNRDAEGNENDEFFSRD